MDALIFLGTGSGLPTPDRYHSSILLETGGHRCLLDAGEPCSQRLRALGVRYSSLDAVMISHGHSDHLSGLPMVIQGAWLEGRSAPLPLYLPGELITPLRNWLEAVYLPEQLIGFSIEYHAWEEGPARPLDLEAGSLEVSINPTSHLYGLREAIDATALDRFRAYSIVCDWPRTGKRLVYSADLGSPRDMDAILDRPCDLLVCEMNHFEPEDLFTYLATKEVRRLCLTHFAYDAQTEEICRAGREALGIEVVAMTDGARVEF